MSHLDRFPRLSREEYEWLLRPPTEPVRCVIDTDARNEIDDQFALAWALLSGERLNIEAIYAAPYSFLARAAELRQANRIRQNITAASAEELALLQAYAAQLKRLEQCGIDPDDDRQIDPQGTLLVSPAVGMELSYQEILRVGEVMDIDLADKVYRGSTGYLASYDQPQRSAAVDHLIETAKTASIDAPLHVAVIGAPVNIAAALLLAPEIIGQIVVSWTAGYPTWVQGISQPSFNMEQCILSSQLLFDSGLPLVYLPGFHVGAQLRLSRPEVKAWVKGRGALGDWLHWLFIHNPHYRLQGIADDFGRSWVIWDLINFAWLINPAWVPTVMRDAPYLTADRQWQAADRRRHPIREGLDVQRDAIFRDFFRKLDAR